MFKRTGLVVRRIAGQLKEERGEVNVSMISWMVLAVVVVVAAMALMQDVLLDAVGFVRAQLGI